MPHSQKIEFVQSMALAWQACWSAPIPPPRQVGELLATTDENDIISLSVGPDRHFSLGGPFTSVRDWLEGRIRHAHTSLEKQEGIDE
jgi:hypothetical protein